MFIIDAQLSPHLAKWLNEEFHVDAYSLTYFQMQFSDDLSIYNFARENRATVITKDSDFVQLQERLGSPPKIIFVTCGNTSNQKMKEILKSKFPLIIELLQSNNLVELAD
jgi:predicted nuclease of predicted toxin-antitoxin system